jgi:probable phosphoglycerate mutase
MLATFPSQARRFHSHPATNPLPNAERGLEACQRALPTLAMLVNEAPEGNLMIVSHSTLIRLALCWLLGLPIDEYRRLMPKVGNVARTTIEIGPGWRPVIDSDLALHRPATAALLAYNCDLPA